MKKVLFIIILSFIGVTIRAQNINKIEYFIDADPGYGAGTDVPITATTPITVNFNVPVISVTDGFHFLNIRAKDINNAWSIVGSRPFYKEAVSTATVPNIVAIEYFIDADPGFGLATSVSVTAGSPVTQNFTASLTSVTDGFHFLSLRAKDANNRWSVVAIRPFYKEAVSTATVPNIVAMEYFIDADPGFGLATAVSVTAGSPLTQNFTAALGSLTNGTHKLSIRAKDINNKWSIVSIKDFTVQDNIIVLGALPNEWCKVTNFNIPFTITGTYTAGNIFTAQLSNSSGTFTSGTTNLGTLTSIAAGTIVANIPNTVTLGSNYQIRLISTSPSITNSPTKPIGIISICPPPCAGLLDLVNPTDNYSSGIITKEANATTGTITATNLVSGTARVTYLAGKSVTLNAGFSAANGTVFKAEIGGCN